MPDLQKLYSDKEKILSTLRQKGPSFPSRISREVGISPLFVSALLSELLSERKLKLSHMKVGSSPIYLIPGQETRLEEFSQYLNNRERDAFNIIKEKSVLEDEKLAPAIRVALRSIKDFAIPVSVKVRGETKLFWKFFTATDETAKEKIQSIILPALPPAIKEEKVEPLPISPKVEEFIEPANAVENIVHEPEAKPERRLEKEPPMALIETKTPIQRSEKPKKEYEFPNSIKDYLLAKDIEVLEDLLNKKKEFISKIRIDTLFGKQEYYLTAKEKKKVSEQDLAIAVQKAQAEKMPALFIAPGDLDKNAKEYIKHWRNLIKFEKITI